MSLFFVNFNYIYLIYTKLKKQWFAIETKKCESTKTLSLPFRTFALKKSERILYSLTLLPTNP